MVLDWGLNPGPPALEASTIPLGYRGGGVSLYELKILSGSQLSKCVDRKHDTKSIFQKNNVQNNDPEIKYDLFVSGQE